MITLCFLLSLSLTKSDSSSARASLLSMKDETRVGGTYSCHHYADGESDSWCASAGSPYVYTKGNNDKYPGCGYCHCCVDDEMKAWGDEFENWLKSLPDTTTTTKAPKITTTPDLEEFAAQIKELAGLLATASTTKVPQITEDEALQGIVDWVMGLISSDSSTPSTNSNNGEVSDAFSNALNDAFSGAISNSNMWTFGGIPFQAEAVVEPPKTPSTPLVVNVLAAFGLCATLYGAFRFYTQK